MTDYYDREGKPMTMDEWAKAYEGERRIGKTDLPDGKMVSTVWLGMNHRWGDGPPLIFETMVFGPDELDCERYSTEAEAADGHRRMVEKWAALAAAGGKETPC